MLDTSPEREKTFIFSMATCALFVLTFTYTASASSGFAGGTGMAEDPYIIETHEQLNKEFLMLADWLVLIIPYQVEKSLFETPTQQVT